MAMIAMTTNTSMSVKPSRVTARKRREEGSRQRRNWIVRSFSHGISSLFTSRTTR
jgi:hypothetical protein